jgi:hypothetical protein
MDENAGGISGGGVAAHHEVGVAALLEVRSKSVLQAAHRPRLGTLENQLFSIYAPDVVLF